MNVTSILKDSLSFFFSNIKQITLLCLPILLIGTILDRALVLHYEKSLGMGITTFASLILWLLIYPIYTGALILLISKRTQQEYPYFKDLILASLKIWYRLFLVSTFSTCMFLFGLMLFVLPGIWVLVRLSFSEMFLVVRGLSPMEAIRQSYISTQQHFWILLVFFMPFLIIHFVLDRVIHVYDQSYISSVAVNTSVSFLGLFLVVVVFRIFMLSPSEHNKS